MNDMKQAAAAEIAVREGNEMVKALIAKVIDLGTAVKDTSELIRQLPNQQDALERWNQQSDKLAENIGKLETCIREMTGAFDQRLQGFAGQMKGVDKQLVGMEALQEALDRHAGLFEKPLVKTVHYRHFLGKPFWVLLAVAVVVGLMAFGWMRTATRSEQWSANDSKWRYMAMTRDTLVLHKVEGINRDYLADPEAFKKLVGEEEERRAEEVEKMGEEEANRQDADSLYRGERIK
jgi:hypothetical protein